MVRIGFLLEIFYHVYIFLKGYRSYLSTDGAILETRSKILGDERPRECTVSNLRGDEEGKVPVHLWFTRYYFKQSPP